MQLFSVLETQICV